MAVLPVFAEKAVEEPMVGDVRWIGSAPDTVRSLSAARARVFFDVASKPCRKAVVRIASPCFCEVWLDGEKVDPLRVLSPACTDYEIHVNEDAYDVADRLASGRHCLGLWIAPGYGFDFQPVGWRWIKPKCVRAVLEIEYGDGTRQVVASGPDWQYRERSPILFASVYHGEVFDARLEDPDWCRVGGKDDGWSAACAATEYPRGVKRSDQPAIRLCDPLKPVSIRSFGEGRFIADFGINRAGVVALCAKGSRGTVIRIRTAEEVKSDGTLDVRTNRNAKNQDTWTLVGTGGKEEFRPRFTYHGFRYAEIEGYPGDLTADDIVGWAVCSDFPVRGRFDCSHAGLRQLRDAAFRSMTSNMLAYPSDCCQRDERTPCLMDVETYMDVACKSFAAQSFFNAYIGNIRPERTIKPTKPRKPEEDRWTPQRCNPDWNGCAIDLPWTLWMEYGDRSMLETHYPVMKATADAFLKVYPDYRCLSGYGDWCPPNDGRGRNWFSEAEFVNSALLVRQLEHVSLAAKACRREEESSFYARHTAGAKAVFNARYFDADKMQYGSGRQITYVLPLAFGIVPETLRTRVGAKLVEIIRGRDGGKLDVGIFGARYLPEVLCDIGEADLAIELLMRPDYPGFGFMFASGATSLWEQWKPHGSMHSHNHAMLSGVTTFFHTRLAGIRPLEPGYVRIAVDPVFPRALDHVSASIQAAGGEIVSSWRRVGDKIEVKVSIPGGIAGTCLGRRLTKGENVIQCDENHFFLTENKKTSAP